MSQSRFSIVLVGVSALLRRPLVSRLRPADGERSSWVVFAARSCRFDSGFRSVVGLRVHRFRFSACTDSEWPSAGWFFRLPLRRLPSASWPSGSPLPLFGTHRFGVASASWFFRLPLRRLPSAGWPSGSLLPLFGTHRFGVATGRVRSSAFRFGDSARRLAFGFTASAFRHAPFRSCRSASWPSGSPLPLFGMHRFGVAAGRVRSSAFRFGVAVRRVGLRAHCFRFSARTDPHRSAPPKRGPTEHNDTTLVSLQTLIPTC